MSLARQAARRTSGGHGSQALLLSLLVLAAMAGVGWVYMGMITRDRWPIRWLELTGSFEHVSAEQVRTRLMPLVTGSFFTVDLAGIDATVRQIPWVSYATVQKIWPDTVRVEVREFLPRAHWTDGRLLADGARMFSVPGADGMQGLPWLEGPEGSADRVYGAWQQFNQILQPAGLEIDRIRLDRRGAWYLELVNGTRVQIGREDAAARLERMAASWQGLLRDREQAPVGLDLRYSNGFAVRWAAPEASGNPG